MTLNEGHIPRFHYELKWIRNLPPVGAGMQVI